MPGTSRISRISGKSGDFLRNPGLPGNPGFPENPEYSENPGFPEDPEILGNPGFSGNPGFPGNPGCPGNPGFHWKPGCPGNLGVPSRMSVFRIPMCCRLVFYTSAIGGPPCIFTTPKVGRY